MMVWLMGQLIRECLHEKKAGAVETVESIMKIKKRISSGFGSFRRSVHLATNEDFDEGDGSDVNEIELRPRTWSQPNNPAMNIDESNSKDAAFMAAPPPAPTKKNTSEQSEQIRKGRLKSSNARRRRDLAYSNPMQKRKQRKKGVGDVDAEITSQVDE